MGSYQHRKTGTGQILLAGILGLYAAICLLPMLLILIVSFSSEASVNSKGFSYFPNGWSLKAFEYVATFKSQLIQSYLVTIFETVCGTLLTLLFTSMFAYALSRKDFLFRKVLTVYLMITMMFGGGLMASYLVNTNIWHLKDNLLVLIVPGAVSAFNCIIMRTFIQTNVPDSLIEAAKIDGAKESYLFFRIVLPIMLPVLSAIGFMNSVGHWNEWQTAFLYIDNPDYATLQLMLIRVEKNLSFLQERLDYLSAEELLMLKEAPSQTARMALLLFTLGPIMVLYPFFQKYFIQGITIGAVKG